MNCLKFFIIILFTCHILDMAAQTRVSDIKKVEDIDPITRIYKKISVDSIRRTEDISNLYSLINFEKEKEVLAIQEGYLYHDRSDICITKLGLTMISFRLNKVDEAVEYGESIINIINSSKLSMSNEFMLNLYANLASSYLILHNYEMANQMYDNLLACSMSDEYRAFVLNDIAGNYLQQNEVDKAKNVLSQARTISESLNNETLNCLLTATLANVFRIGGEYEKCLDTIQNLFNDDNFNDVVNNLGERFKIILYDAAMWSSHMLGDDKSAIKFGEILKDNSLIEKIDPLTLATILLNYSIVESSYIDGDRPEGFPDVSEEEMSNWLNRFRASLETKQKVYDIYRDYLGENSDEALMTMASIASLYAQIGYFQECVDISSDLINICEQSEKYDSSYYQLALHLICNSDIVADEFWAGPALSINFDIKSIADKLMLSLKNKPTSYTQNVLWSTLFHTYVKNKEFNKAAECLQNHFTNLKQFVSSNLIEIDDVNTINSYWESISYNILTGIECKELWNNLHMKEMFYNKALFYKGMKLELVTSIFNDNTKKLLLQTSWKDIRDSLQDNSAAVEIIKTLDYAEDGAHNIPAYYALILTKKSESPELRYICTEAEILKYNPGDYYNSSKLTNCLFGTISEFLEGENISTIYFSPMGEFCNIAIESLRTEDGGILSDKFELYRLSSTRILLKDEHKSEYNLLAFGDIDFDADSSSLKEEQSKRIGEKHLIGFNRLRGNLRGLHFGRLKGTKIELDSIATICKYKQITYHEFRKDAATELKFRNLLGNDINICHIATHGFLWNGFNDYKNRLTLSVLSEVPDFIEDLSMLNSGILLAGANNTLKKDSIGNLYNDGIITAYEISQLPLSNIDLIVLSACETGLGKIKGDGVFGLQRGFKQAGVNSIIMSLWEVDDDATQMLMTEFYKNYLSGMSKRKSLSEAQRSVRNTSGFEDPEYWAAFILLDGLN